MIAARSKSEILLAEDDPAIGETLQEILEGAGYDVTWVMNGADALARLREGLPADLILLDLMMPVMDGWQFREGQRRDPTLAGIPVIVVSADHEAGHHAGALEADAILPKPFSVDALLRLVERYCGPGVEPGAAPARPEATVLAG